MAEIKKMATRDGYGKGLVALGKEHVELCGYHCHIGSQIFEHDPFCDAAVLMLKFIAEIRAKHGYMPKYLNLGGGMVTDLGIKDANNMGAAMAPAAFSTICAHFDDLKTGPEDFDLIVTGDLGQLGKELLIQLALKNWVPLG